MRLFNDFSANNFRTSFFWAIIAFAIATTWPIEAFAITQTLGEIICKIRYNAGITPTVLSVISYICGAFMIVNGVLLLIKHFNNTNDSQVTKACAYLFSGACLMTLPSIAGVIQGSVFAYLVGGNNTDPCTVAPIPTGAQGLDTMMQNFVNNIRGPIFMLCATIGQAIGILMIVRALMKAAKTGTDARAAAPHAIIVNLLIGAILISLSSMLPIMLGTVFADKSIAAFPVINWTKITGSSFDPANVNKTIEAILRFVQVVGIIGFLRGWLIIKNAVEGTGQATVPQGMTHIIGGTMAVNIGAMLTIIDRTFGTGILSP